MSEADPDALLERVRAAEAAAGLDAERCNCGPGDIRPRRGTRCGRCDLYVIGPARPGDRAYVLEQARHAPASHRAALAGLAGGAPRPTIEARDAREEELAMRAARARERRGRQGRHEEQRRAEHFERMQFGIGALQKLYAPLVSKVKANRRRAARKKAALRRKRAPA